MGAHVRPASLDEPRLAAFTAALAAEGYEGEVAGGLVPRLAVATDNSIYQRLPALVLHPRTGDDLNRILRAARRLPGAPIPLTLRGGGTGTNGQSLTTGVVVDASRHLDRILALDVSARTVTVEPGVVLDQLNAVLRPYGLFFPPSVSTASRATIGGMVATDASGKGSRIYGKTSAWIEALHLVLSDGADWVARTLAPEELEAAAAVPGVAGAVHREVRRVVTERAALIAETFPRLNRSLTGYNLADVLRPDGGFSLPYLLAGSEGTLAVTKAITLRLAARPRHRALVVARYAAFDTALRDVRNLLAAEPLAVEVLDDKVLALAAGDIVWAGIEGVLGGPAARPVMGLNFIEFAGDDPGALEASTRATLRLLEASPHRAMDWTAVHDPAVMAQLWTLRERSVGLLGRLGGTRQGTAFVEDTAVPPERLADFVAEFRTILDRHGLRYGMYGHADVGCLHVRPLLDMADPVDAAVIRPVSDAVAALAKRYGGLLWGEHGRGFRGEYSPLFFGPELYGELCRIKRAFDPDNVLNPGKLATPDDGVALDRIDAVPLRGEADRTVAPERARLYDRALACNGNAACHSWDATEPMCPSYKATRDRVQSPKGRAMALREWARLASAPGGAQASALAAVEEEVKATLDTCLSCKACSNQCPVKVDVPTMRSRFLADYYRTRPRPLRDRLVAGLEVVLPLARRFPRVANGLMARPWLQRRLRDGVGLVDLPVFAPARPERGRPSAGRAGRVVVLRDSFVASFDGQVHDAACRVLGRLGYDVVSSPVWANGKAEHVLGMPARFARRARAAQAMRMRLAADGAQLVSLDAATGLLFQQEYQEFAPLENSPAVLSLDQFLAGRMESRAPGPPASGPPFRILLHCTERTSRPETGERWRRVMAGFGLAATVPALGCCGMAGLFGHEAEHAALSGRIFDLSWRAALDGTASERVLATGFSCRCQTKRLVGTRPRHPIEAILSHLEGRPA